MHSKTKHIPIKYHFLREKVSQKMVKLEYIDTKEHIDNIFTKPLPKEAFENLCHNLGVISLQSREEEEESKMSRGDMLTGGAGRR